jgi:hypothetical protein
MNVEAPRRKALRPEGIRSKPIRMARVFDDPEAVLRLVRDLAPYSTVGTYYNGGQPNPDGVDPPWFLVEPDSALIIDNPNWIVAAREAFGAGIVHPIRCVVNLNPSAPASPPHLDLPVFRGFSAPRIPIWLLMCMSHSRLFLDWLVPLASGIAWFWRGQGGEFEYWPDGSDGAPASENAPLWNVGVMSDNEAMWHRVGAIGPAECQSELAGGVPGTAQMHCADVGWEIRDADRVVASYGAEDVRISIVWKGYVFKDEAHLASFEDSAYDLDLDLVVEIFRDNLAARGLPSHRPTDPMTDKGWQALVQEAYVSPFLS